MILQGAPLLRSLSSSQLPAPTAPTTPTISGANDGNGTSATITVDGDSGVTNRLYYRAEGGTTWTAGLTRSGDGTIVQTGLTAATYYFWVVSDDSGAYSLPSNIAKVVLRSQEVTISGPDPQVQDTFRHFFVPWVLTDEEAGPPIFPDTHQEDNEPFVALTTRQIPQDKNPMLWGCRDGYIRWFSDTQETDEGYKIDSYAAIGPFPLGGGTANKGLVVELEAVLDKDSGPMSWWLYVADTPEDALRTEPFDTGAVTVGRNYVTRPRARGAVAILMIGNGDARRAWAMEGIRMRVRPTGRFRK